MKINKPAAWRSKATAGRTGYTLRPRACEQTAQRSLTLRCTGAADAARLAPADTGVFLTARLARQSANHPQYTDKRNRRTGCTARDGTRTRGSFNIFPSDARYNGFSARGEAQERVKENKNAAPFARDPPGSRITFAAGVPCRAARAPPALFQARCLRDLLSPAPSSRSFLYDIAPPARGFLSERTRVLLKFFTRGPPGLFLARLRRFLCYN